MADKQTLARPYARAVFEVAKEQGALESWLNLLSCLALISNHGEVLQFLRSPSTELGKVELFLKEVCESFLELSPLQFNFIRVLVAGRRLELAQQIKSSYVAFFEEEQQRKTLEITTASPLTSEQKDMLIERFGRELNRKIILNEKLDANLLGGFILKNGDQVVDASLKGQLFHLKDILNAS